MTASNRERGRRRRQASRGGTRKTTSSAKRKLRIVLDTNVILSALLFRGKPREVVDLVIAGVVDCTLSTAILQELSHVLQRPKFGFSAEMCLTIVEELHAVCDINSFTEVIDVVTADPDDNRILECALEAGVQLIVSGDSHLLKLQRYEGVEIQSPTEFLKTVAK